MENEEFDLDKELMDVRVRRIQEERKRRQDLEEKLESYKIKRIKQTGLAIGLAGAIAVTGIGFSIGRSHMGIKPTTTVITENDETVTLARNYTVQFGDTLTAISRQTGIPISQIQQDNDIPNPNDIKMNEKLLLNYSVNIDDLDYYTQTINMDGKSLAALAAEYNTTVNTIIEINGGKIDELSNTILVPNFITPQELQESKSERQR